MRHPLPWLAATAAVLGCTSASSGPPAQTNCDPLATHPTTLATILGVGQDPGGTLYVADYVPTEPMTVRVFIPTHGVLVRQYVIGSGLSNGEDLETFESPDGSTPPRDLAIEVQGEKAIAMTVGPEGSAKSNIDGMDGGASTPLTLLDPSTVQGLPAIDLPGAVSYVADGADGNAIVVTAPLENDVGSAALRLFYGTPNAMVERPIVSFNQSISGYPSIGFTVGSQTYVMAIASAPYGDGGVFAAPGPVTVTGGAGGSVSFTLRAPTPATLAGFTFSCLGN